MVGDMIIKGQKWCRKLPSLNLHPDLPLSLGGTEGIYWEVIGEWVNAWRKRFIYNLPFFITWFLLLTITSWLLI